MSQSFTTTDSSDTCLWNAFRMGSRIALDKIYQNHIRPLYGYGCKLTQDKELVEDCIQDMFVALWEKRENLGATTSIKFYLFKVLRRTLMHRLHQNKTYSDNSLFLKDLLSDDPVEFKLMVEQAVAQRKKLLQQAIDRLSHRQKEVIFLRFYDELEFEEIAQIMGIDIKSAYKLTYKAIASLKKHLSPRSIIIHTLLILLMLLFMM